MNMLYKHHANGKSFTLMRDDTHRNREIKRIFDFMESVKINPQIENFVESIRNFFLAKGYLTDKQYNALLNIYERL